MIAMKNPSNVPPALVVLATALLLTACERKAAPVPDTPVNEALTMVPPIARTVDVRFAEDDPNGNVFVMADFGPGTIKGEFHAVIVDEQKMVMRDDGLGGDAVKGDGIFTVALKEDIGTTTEMLATDQATMKKELLARPTFIGREQVPTPEAIKALKPFDKELFLKGTPFSLFGTPCTPVTDVSIDHSLMVTNVAVVEDVVRTAQPCTRPSATGAWTFGRLMTDMANEPVSGVSAEDFVKNWLRTWLSDTPVNGDLVEKRTRMFDSVIRPWVIASGSPAGSFTIDDWETKPLDLAKAPFKLTAIVNRLDLRGNTGYSVTNAGEGRFVFETLTGACAPLTGPGGFTVIFEFGIPITACRSLRSFGQRWYDLKDLALGSPEYNAALQAITDVFATANASPSRPNGSAINQIRTNEFALGSPWELREFNIDPSTHQLFLTTVKQEPAKKYNARAIPPGLPPDVTKMADWVNANAADIVLDKHVVPVDIGTEPFLGGKSHTEGGRIWNAAPGQITNPEARHHFSLNTCSGCHGGETNTPFLQVGLAPFGAPAPLAGFLRGITVNDPVSSTPHTFNDLARRQDDLARVLCLCSGKRLFDLVHVLTFKPLHMTH